jgi:hypothetical protein
MQENEALFDMRRLPMFIARSKTISRNPSRTGLHWRSDFDTSGVSNRVFSTNTLDLSSFLSPTDTVVRNRAFCGL